MSERDSERSVSQTVRAQLALRDMILSGRLRPGERISELQAVDVTGVSRTPVRLALVRLEDEGLLQAIPSGGFMVKAFTERDILDSIELRGTLEGLAARFAAERGVSARSLEPLKECLADLDQLVRQDPISVEAFSAYVTMNARFHALLNELSAQRAADPGNRPRLGAAVRLPQRVRDGAIGAAGGAPDPAARAGSSPHRGRRDREPRRRARRGRDARAFAARRAQPAAGDPKSHASRFAACAGVAQIISRIGIAMRFAEQWSWCTVAAIRDVTPRIREFRLRPDNGLVPPYPAGSHIGVTVLIDGQPARRSYSLVGEQRSQHLSHRGPARAGQPRRLARDVEFADRARGSRPQIRRRSSRSTGAGGIIA